MLCLNRKAEQVDRQTLPVTQLLSLRAQRSGTQELQWADPALSESNEKPLFIS